MKVNLKTPISYYGGKQSMLTHILPLIPAHQIYCEPFFGGGAVFWAKPPIKTEIINDYNGMVVNFYRQLRENFTELKRVIDATPYSREAYKQAMVVYDHPYIFNELTKAWAFWVGTIQGFSNQIGSWRCSQPRVKESLLNSNKKLLINEEMSERLNLVQIENIDAVELIKRMDSEDSFFYIDPPYVGANQGHYGGYSQQHFDELLECLSNIKGKFLLSSYPNDNLAKFVKKNKWVSRGVEMNLTVSMTAGKKKIEQLTANYPI